MAVATTNEPNSGGLPASPVNPEVINNLIQIKNNLK